MTERGIFARPLHTTCFTWQLLPEDGYFRTYVAEGRTTWTTVKKKTRRHQKNERELVSGKQYVQYVPGPHPNADLRRKLYAKLHDNFYRISGARLHGHGLDKMSQHTENQRLGGCGGTLSHTAPIAKSPARQTLILCNLHWIAPAPPFHNATSHAFRSVLICIQNCDLARGILATCPASTTSKKMRAISSTLARDAYLGWCGVCGWCRCPTICNVKVTHETDAHAVHNIHQRSNLLAPQNHASHGLPVVKALRFSPSRTPFCLASLTEPSAAVGPIPAQTACTKASTSSALGNCPPCSFDTGTLERRHHNFNSGQARSKKVGQVNIRLAARLHHRSLQNRAQM